MKQTKSEIYEKIRADIMNLKLAPGSLISETDFCELYGISRTPIREIFKKLEEENLLEIYPQIGSYVSKIDLKMVNDALFLRNLCENEIIKESINNPNKNELINELKKNVAFQEINANFNGNSYDFFKLDNEFHSILFSFNERENIWKNILKFTTHYDRLRLIDAVEKTNQEKTILEHKHIIEIIEKGDIEEVNKTVVNHLEKFKMIIDKFITKYPDYFK